jgi:DNA sulfur modification protein DndD
VERPVILVGGHNGAGKTTILASLQLALYGRLALGGRVTDREYEEYLRGLIHRRKDTLIPLTAAGVEVEFEHARAGERSTYTVSRSWQLRNERVEEQLSVMRNGGPLSDVEAEFWPEFVRGLVPYGLSQLFFFDGEKIQKLAEADTESEALADSVKALLGLDLVERLHADLSVLIERRVRAADSGERSRRLEEIEQKLAEIEREDHAFQQKQAQAQTSLDHLTARAERVERKLAHSGKGLASRRDEFRDRSSDMKAKIEATEKQLRDLCEVALPFALCPKLCGDVLEQLERETSAERWGATREELQRAFKSIRKRLATRFEGTRRLATNTREHVLTEVAEAFKRIEETKAELQETPSIHDASELGRGYLRQVLSGERRNAAAKLQALSKDLLISEEKLNAAQQRLNAVPDNEELRPLIAELSEVQAKRGELNLQLSTISEARLQLTHAREKIIKESRKLVEARADHEKGDSHVALAGRAQHALAAYLERLTAAKTERLETEALACFKQLCRKDDLIEAMSIDPHTFHVTLRDHRGRELPKRDLSAGEKQLYAVALLWALARVSGRPLPMVVDTPLGRLDSAHRHNLVERYFPHASHQVVVLSTDTEVDQACFETLKACTSHSIRLEHHQRDGWTEVGPGYFWKGDGLAAVSA